jgi:hypothetical protein
MARALFIATIIFAVAYALALIVLLIGTFGLFGADRDPLSGVFLVPLGLPWNRFIDGFPEPAWPWLASAAPLVNLIILWALRRLALNRKG